MTDPGGGFPDAARSASDLTNLQESFNEQQAKISALKELARQAEVTQGRNNANAQEKIRNIAQRLTHLKTKASKSRQQDRSLSEIQDEIIHEESAPILRPADLSLTDPIHLSTLPRQHSMPTTPNAMPRAETPGSEKILLLRQQMEQNRLKMKEQANSKRGIEELVTQLKARFESTQQSLERSSELGRSVGDLSAISAPMSRYKSVTDLTSAVTLNLEKERIKFLENRCKNLEKQITVAAQTINVEVSHDSESNKIIKNLENRILDLEENLKEKDHVIEARTQAVGLMSKNLSLKGKNTIDLLEETKLEMMNMQTNFLRAEENYKMEFSRLTIEIESKNLRIANLEEQNCILETARFELTVRNSELEAKIEDVQEYSNKISELNKMNQSLQHRISDLENQKYDFITEDEIELTKQETAQRLTLNVDLEERVMQLQIENDELKKSFQDKLYVTDEDMSGDELNIKILSLQNTIEAQSEELENVRRAMAQMEEAVTEKTIEYNVLVANFSVLEEKLKSTAPKSLFSQTTDEGSAIEINKLKTQLDESNRLQIKNKLKMKQMQKQIDSFKKISDANQQVLKLTEEVQQLNLKNAELEEEKGNLQLRLVNSDVNPIGDIEIEKKLNVLEATCQNQTSAIQLLEEQKIDMTEDLNSTKTELESLRDHMKEIDREEGARVVSHMDSIELEEKNEKFFSEINGLKSEIETLQNTIEDLRHMNGKLIESKEELSTKLNCCLAENMELLDKIEKLSKNSSAESIEIVEGLTHQEKLEMEEFHKQLADKVECEQSRGVGQSVGAEVGDEHNESIMSQDLSDSLIKLREESSELMHKIELFTTERREVLDKMEKLTIENKMNVELINHLKDEKLKSEEALHEMKHEKNSIVQKLKSVELERNHMGETINDLQEQRHQMQETISCILRAEDHASQEKKDVSEKLEEESIKKEKLEHISSTESIFQIDESFTLSLSALESEIENFRKARDKSSKMSTSKKLAKEAQTVHAIVVHLVQEYEQRLSEIRQLKQNANQHIITDDTVEETKELKRKLAEMLSNEMITSDKLSTLTSQSNQLSALSSELQSQLIEKEQRLTQTEKKIYILESELKTKVDEAAGIRKENDCILEEMKLCQEAVVMKDDGLAIQHEEMQRLKKEFDGKLEVAEKQNEILSDLIKEQKQQLIDTFTEHEVEMGEKLKQIEVYESRIAMQRNELIIAKQQSSVSNEKYTSDLQDEIRQLKTLCDENEKLLANQTEDVIKKQNTIDTLNSQIMDLYKTMEENANKVIEKEDEIVYLQEIIDSNNDKLLAITATESENSKKIQSLLQELKFVSTRIDNVDHKDQTANKNISEFENKIVALEQSNREYIEKNKDQLDKLKKFAANLKKKVAQCNDLEKQIKVLENQSVDSSENKTAELASENERLNETISSLQAFIDDLQHQLTFREESIHSLKESQTELQNAFKEARTENNELSQKNESLIGHLEKELKHFKSLLQTTEDNLELKDRHIKELKDDYSELNKNSSIIQDDLNKYKENYDRVVGDNHIKIEKCKAIIKDRNKQIKKLQEELLAGAEKSNEATAVVWQENLNHLEEEYKKSQTELYEMNKKFNKLLEDYNQLQVETNLLHESNVALNGEYNIMMANHEIRLTELNETMQAAIENQKLGVLALEEEIVYLKAQLKLSNDNHRSIVEMSHAKTQENLMFTESLQQENIKLQEKIAKMEEGISYIEERRNSLERQKNILGNQLEEKSHEFEQHEDELLQRLAALSQRDDVIEIKLKEADSEKLELLETLKELKDEKNILLKKIDTLEKNIKEIEESNNEFDLERENLSLKESIATLQSELKRQLSDFDSKLALKHSEVDDLENQLSSQLSDIEDEKKQLQESLEKSRDENSELQDEMVRIKESNTALEQSKSDMECELTWIRMQNENMTQDNIEVQELRMQIVQDQTEIENLKHQHQACLQNHDIELHALRQQIAELDNLRMQVGQNQTDDQVFIQNENERLKQVLSEKEAEIQNYQRQNLQLQMAATFGQQTTSGNDPFSTFTTPQPALIPNDDIQQLTCRIVQLEDQIQACSADKVKLEENNVMLQHELTELSATSPALEDKVAELTNKMSDLEGKLNASLTYNDTLHRQIAELQTQHVLDVSGNDQSAIISELNCKVSNLMAQLNSALNDTSRLTNRNSELENEVFANIARIQELELDQKQTIQLHNSNQELQKIALERESEINQMKIELERIEKSTNVLSRNVEVEETVQHFQVNPLLTFNPFANSPTSVVSSTSQESNQQIADLQRNVSDLEKYTAELESKLNNLTTTYEETVSILREKTTEFNVVTYSNQNHLKKISELEAQLSEFNQKLAQLEEQSKSVSNKTEKLVAEVLPNVVQPTIASFDSSLFFGAPDASSAFDQQIQIVPDEIDDTNRVPVVEEIIVPKKAYKCSPVRNVETQSQDEGWGWGSEEAILEEQHQQQSQTALSSSVILVPPSVGYDVKLQDFEDRIRELQLERDRLKEENIVMQIKSGKMLKKLKEYKSKNDDLASSVHVFKKSPSIEPTNDLDLAIQEELNNQVKSLETKVKEMREGYDKMEQEKQNLLKRLDILTAANDRMTEMKERQDIDVEMYQSKVKQLSIKVQHLEEWSAENNDSPKKEVPVTPSTQLCDLNSLNVKIADLEASMKDLQVDNEELQALLEEERSNTGIYEKRIENLQKKIDSYEMEAYYSSDLKESIKVMEVQIAESTNTIQQKIDENLLLLNQIDGYKSKISELSNEIERMKTASLFQGHVSGSLLDNGSSKFDELEQKVQELTASSQYKDAEITQLNLKIENLIKEDQTQSLVQEILLKNLEITALRSSVTQLENDKIELENNLSLQLTQEHQNEKLSSLEVELQERNYKLHEFENTITELSKERDHMTEELHVLNDQVMKSLEYEDKIKSLALEIDSKNIEIAEMKNSLEQLKDNNQFATSDNDIIKSLQLDNTELQASLRITVDNLNSQWGIIVEQRNAEVAESWRQHLTQREEEFAVTEQHLKEEITALQQQLHRQTSKSSNESEECSQEETGNTETNSTLVKKMQEVLEAQEIEIVTLKEQLAITSAEYARLVAQVDPHGHKSTILSKERAQKKSMDSTDSVAQKSELDLALYMLHQRDMRCEELTQELINLLEERDMLQLKLSNALRQNEDRKTGITPTSDTGSSDVTPEKLPTKTDETGTIPTTTGHTEQQGVQALESKINLLHDVSHSRDKTLRAEREQRQRQMSLLQRDVANMPPEAVAELFGADYTLSRTSQSPSAVLLNWLWGKSTPKEP